VIEAVAVVVPAHDEEALLPACLRALRRAASLLSLPVQLLVVADACTDRTVTAARAGGAQVTGIEARSVGAARAAGMAEALQVTAGIRPPAVWLATTDADTVVPPHWLRRQLRYASQGWDVVLGTVSVADWDGHPPHIPAAFEAQYGFGDGPHPHVHGANLGIRASAYLAAGGFMSLPTAEDHALLAAVTEAGCALLQASDITVQTSARRLARAPGGFSHLLRVLAEQTGVAQPATDSRGLRYHVSAGFRTGISALGSGELEAELAWAPPGTVVSLGRPASRRTGE
jgi:Glycosyl transferase family 2